MTRPLFVGLMMLLPALASAQTPPPRPVPQPAPPAPPAPAPRLAPPAPVAGDWATVEDALRAAQDSARWVDTDAIREQTRQAADEVRAAQDQIRAAADAARRVQLDDLRNTFDWQSGQMMTFGPSSSEGSTYQSGLSLEDDHKYDQAIARFDKVIGQKGAHADGALYHKAYCQARLGQSTEAVATLAELRKSYDKSPYLKDAAALEADVKKLGPSQVDDEDVKILAIQSLQYQDPDQAIPLLEGVLDKTNSLKTKYQALYVLAGIDQPRAHQDLLRYAKGAGNPELQRRAISYLGSRGQKTTVADLTDIYNSTTDTDIRLAVISAFSHAGAKSPLISIASGHGIAFNGTVVTPVQVAGETPTVLRTRAMSGLTDIATPQEVRPLYQKEDNKDLRLQWVNVFQSMGAVDQLLEIARTDKDPSVRARAIRTLGSGGSMKSDKTSAALMDMYAAGDKDTKAAVISALGSQNNAEGLVTIARKETDPELKRQIVQRLADMAKTSKVAMDYLMEIIR